MSKWKFYVLSFTWGLPVTLCGLLVAAVLMIAGNKPSRFGYCMAFEVGERWGGLSLGVVIITDKTPSDHTMNHEHGHALQNCLFGVFMPFVVCIPSAVRYWWRKYQKHKGKTDLPPYDAIWFEGQATRIGTEFIENIT